MHIIFNSTLELCVIESGESNNMMKKNILAVALVIIPSVCQARFTLDRLGMYVNSNDNNNVIVVTNVGDGEIILFSTEDLELTKEISGRSLFYLNPPVTKLQPNESRSIRVVLKDNNIKEEVLGRLSFKEVAAVKNVLTKVVVNSAYNISVIGHPDNIINNYKPWESLSTAYIRGELFLTNNSPYVIKLMSSVDIIKEAGDKIEKSIGRTFILPKTKVSLGMYAKNDALNFKNIIIQPASVSSNILPPYKVAVKMSKLTL